MLEMLKPSDKITILAKLDPVSQGAATVTTGWILAADYHQFLAELDVGLIAATGTLNAKLEQATDGSGTGVKDVTGSAITALTDVDDNKIVLINLDPNKLDVVGNFDYFRLSVTAAVAASLIAARVYGINPRYGVAAQIAAVDEIVTVF